MLSDAAFPQSVTVPRSSPVVVSKKSMVPPGVPEPGALAVTLAVNVTDSPNGLVLAEAVAVVVVASLLTVNVPATYLIV